MKNYPLEIEDVSSDDVCIYRSKGHHEFDEFVKAVNEFAPHSALSAPRHVWVKTVPDKTGWYSCLYIIVDKGTRGAYPATYVEDIGYVSPYDEPQQYMFL